MPVSPGGAAPVTSVFGRTGAVALNSNDVTTALTFTPANKAGDTFSGDVVIGAAHPNGKSLTINHQAAGGITLNNVEQGTSATLKAHSGGTIFFTNTAGIYVYKILNPADGSVLESVSGAWQLTGAVRAMRATSTQSRSASELDAGWSVSTDASRLGYGTLSAVDYNNTRECIRWAANGSAPQLGFLGATPVTRPAVSGSRGGNAALASLLTALANLGLITDGSSA